MKNLKFNLSKNRKQSIAFFLFSFFGYSVIAILLLILGFITIRGINVISPDFLLGYPEEGMTKGGIFPAIVGTICLVVGSMLFAIPVGLMSGIYISEYAGNNWLVKFIRIMTNTLSGVPSIVFGLFGMTLFVNTLEFGDSILAGSLTLGLLVLPVIIRTTEEAMRAIPDSFRQGSLSLGASRLQTIHRVTLPMALPNVITGVILSVGRVSGETAPILFTAAAYFLPRLPHSVYDQVMALPYHLYVVSTSGTNIEASSSIAYGTALVLIFIVLFINIIANMLRSHFGKKVKTN